MPSKRSRYKKVRIFYCPHCQQRLWRVGGPKYYIFYQGKAEMQKGLKLSSKKASFLATQQSNCVDLNVWIEEFFCQKDGKIWLHLSQNDEKIIFDRPATEQDWQRTTKTIDPERLNSSVSEFTLRMSRNHAHKIPQQ